MSCGGTAGWHSLWLATKLAGNIDDSSALQITTLSTNRTSAAPVQYHSFGSLAFAAQSLIAALGSVQLIANLFLSRWVSREPVSVRIWAATAIIVVGGVLLVAFGNHESPTYTVANLLSFYSGCVMKAKGGTSSS